MVGSLCYTAVCLDGSVLVRRDAVSGTMTDIRLRGLPPQLGVPLRAIPPTRSAEGTLRKWKGAAGR